jgi:hypothetical protein
MLIGGTGSKPPSGSVGRIQFKTILSEIQVVDIIAADPVEYLTRRIRVSPKRASAL